MSEGLRIKSAVIENFKNIDYKVIEIDGRTLIVSGKNQKGKSSLLQALTCSFNSKVAPIKPVKDGEQQGSVEIVVSGEVDGQQTEYKIGMQFNKDSQKGRLYLIDDEGRTISSGQKSVLDMIIGDISFDIMEFISFGTTENGKPSLPGIQKQIAFLEKLIPEDVLEAINTLKNEKEVVYDQRTEINRVIKHLDGKIKSSNFTQEDIDKYETPQSVQEVVDELEKARKINENIEKSNQFLNSYEDSKKELEDKMKALKESLAKLDENKVKIDAFMKDRVEIDTDAIQDKLSNLSSFNANCQKVADLKETEFDMREKEKQSQKLTERLSTIDAEKDELFKSANLPVDGLNFDETGITYNGLPLHETNLASSELIKIGMKIAMALNPNLRLIVIKDGSLLDKESLDFVIAEAESNGYQLLIEIVSNSEEVNLEFIEHNKA